MALFAWLLTLHPTAAGRVYAAYGAVYVSVALVWLQVVEGVPLTFRDLMGRWWYSAWIKSSQVQVFSVTKPEKVLV